MAGKSNGQGAAACCGAQAVRLGNKVRDPLCGLSVDVNSPYRLDGDARGLRFCSEACRDDYARAVAGEPVPGVSFACPMHSYGRQDEPGECAVCGMKLTPVRTAPPPGASERATGGVLGWVRSALHL